MSTDQTSGRQAEQQLPPADAAGCKSEMDRSVQGTDLASGFAELRARLTQMLIDAYGRQATAFERNQVMRLDVAYGEIKAFLAVEELIDELSGCEGCKLGGS